MRLLFFPLLLLTSIYADEYSFDMSALEEMEPKTYEYKGYLRVEDRPQRLNKMSPTYIQSGDDRDYQNTLHLEALLEFSYFYETLTLKTSVMGTYDYIKDKTAKDDYPINELYLENKFNHNHSALLGKESLKWGKGYFFNPVAFFDRPKDPTQPNLAREGFSILKYSYNKSFQSSLKNISFDLLYLPATDDINKEYRLVTEQKDSNNVGARLYLLYFDTDIDIIYDYSNEAKEKIGIDFSKNLQTNFEVHAEYAKELDGYFSYLLGLRYLSESDLTLISEYLFRSNGLNKNEIQALPITLPFAAKDYLINLLTQKEPLDILYLSVYYKNIFNLQDASQQNKLGFTYSFKNDIELDLSYNINSGASDSEFGKKAVEDFLWLKATWSF